MAHKNIYLSICTGHTERTKDSGKSRELKDHYEDIEKKDLSSPHGLSRPKPRKAKKEIFRELCKREIFHNDPSRKASAGFTHTQKEKM
jgi:hypothetical protein